MLSRRVRENLDAMLQTPGFRVERAGDTFFATAPGHRKKRLMFQGAVTTPAGQWGMSLECKKVLVNPLGTATWDF